MMVIDIRTVSFPDEPAPTKPSLEATNRRSNSCYWFMRFRRASSGGRCAYTRRHSGHRRRGAAFRGALGADHAPIHRRFLPVRRHPLPH
jgi:hypothetical protein